MSGAGSPSDDHPGFERSSLAEEDTTHLMRDQHPGFERSLPDGDMDVVSEATEAALIARTGSNNIVAHTEPLTNARHHHRTDAAAIPVADILALRTPPSGPLPLTPAASQYAADSARPIHPPTHDLTIPTFTITAAHDITEALPHNFGEEMPLLRSVTPEQQLTSSVCTGVVIQRYHEPLDEHEDASFEEQIEAVEFLVVTDSGQQAAGGPLPLRVICEDEGGDEYWVSFVDIAEYGVGSGERAEEADRSAVIDHEYDVDTNDGAGTIVAPTYLDNRDDTESDSDDSDDIDVETIFSDVDSGHSSDSSCTSIGSEEGDDPIPATSCAAINPNDSNIHSQDAPSQGTFTPTSTSPDLEDDDFYFTSQYPNVLSDTESEPDDISDHDRSDDLRISPMNPTTRVVVLQKYQLPKPV